MQQEPNHNVINVDSPTWLTLLMLKESVSLMKTRNEKGRFDIAINKETELFKTIMKETLQ